MVAAADGAKAMMAEGIVAAADTTAAAAAESQRTLNTTLNVWDALTLALVKEVKDAHSYIINHATYSPDGKHVISCSDDKTFKIWDALKFCANKKVPSAPPLSIVGLTSPALRLQCQKL